MNRGRNPRLAGQIEISELRGKMTVKMKDKILFASGSATVGKEGLAALAKVAEALRGVQGKVIRVEGHTDNVGAAAYNKDLSRRRAASVLRYLVAKGVAVSRLEAVGYGYDKPIASNETPLGRARNRRVEFTIVSGQP